MPNDPAGQFPQPTNSSPSSFGANEVKLTDEIAPDLSATPIVEAPPPPPPPPSPQPEPEPEPTPSYSPPPPPPVEVAPLPASLPPTKGGFPVISLLLLFIAVGAIAATYFFFQQTKTLTTQLSEVERTLERQRIEENQITPTPTPLVSPTSTISAVPTGTVSATPTTGQPNPSLAFADITSVIGEAQVKYPNTVLIMVTATGVETVDETIIKYWFRQTPTEKRYLYVLRQVGQPDSIVDTQVFVTPDNNIPSLNQLATSNGLGIDMAEAVAIARAACPTTFNCTTTPLSAQYIKANTTLWQVSFKPSDGSKPFVVQIDSITKKVLFKSL